MLWPFDRKGRAIPTWLDVAGWCIVVLILVGVTLYSLAM